MSWGQFEVNWYQTQEREDFVKRLDAAFPLLRRMEIVMRPGTSILCVRYELLDPVGTNYDANSVS